MWRQVRRSVRPLRSRQPEARAEPPEQELEPAGRAERAVAPAQPGRSGPAAKVGPPPLTLLDPRARRRVSRGAIGIDSRIDLHGMRQDQAFSELMAFLRKSQDGGARLVLVITGKGRQTGHGVLQRLVPAWLARPEFRDLVLGFEPAGPRHGGSGALYVRLRGRR